MICLPDAQWAAPPNSNCESQRWFKVWTTALGATGGYVHSSLVVNQTAVPATESRGGVGCETQGPANPSTWTNFGSW